MIDDKTFAILKTIISQIAPVPDEQMEAFLPLISKAIYKKNEYFARYGERQRHIGVVVSGLFRLFYIDMNGKEYTKNFIGQNGFVSAYNSILKDEPSNLYIQALSDSEVRLIDYSKWLGLADTHMSWQILLRKLTEHGYLQKEKRESDLLFYDAETRYRNFKKEFPGLDQQIRQRHIASFLSMSPETLSRIKKSIT